jgi:hypothetical protein
MVPKNDDILKKLNVPWITKDGYLDLTKFPIESTLKHAVGNEGEPMRSACRILGSMASSGRTEAEVFLYGLLTFCAGNTAKKQSVVEALGQARTQRAVLSCYLESWRIRQVQTRLEVISTPFSKRFDRFPWTWLRGDFNRCCRIASGPIG